MKDWIKLILIIGGYFALVLSAIALAIYNIIYAFQNPELTNTQLAIWNLKKFWWYYILVLLVKFIADKKKGD